MTYDDAVNYIEKSAKLGSILGLSRMEKLCDFLGNPQKNFSVIHVAGTNGKGSIGAMIASILTQAGYDCGMYYSPALSGITDHFKINGELISNEDYAKCIEKVASADLKLKNDSGEGATSFELETAAAFVYFSDRKVDVAVIECGLGGRDDATNIINAKDLCVFASISLDHTAILGNTISKIASVKSGIINCKCPVVCYDSGDEAVKEIKAAADKFGCPVSVARFDELSGTCDYPVGEKIRYKNIEARVNLSGKFQQRNACVAIEAAWAIRGKFNISENAIIKGLDKVIWPFRFEKISDEPLTIVDGAHNPGAAKLLAKTVAERLKGYDIVYVVGMFKDKDCKKVLEEVIPGARRVITVTTSNQKRALGAQELAFLAEKYCSVVAADSIIKAREMAEEEVACLKGNTAIIAFGSLSYLSEFKNGKS